MKEMIRLNSYYEGLIQNLFGSSKGCFSNFMTFFYQYNQVKEFSPENVECMKFLYKAELENCEILSQVLIFIGGDNLLQCVFYLYNANLKQFNITNKHL